ncbi:MULTISPECIES: hypothetical protein [unclassified Acinetobacter]|uniref:hypothetical protein n=1 Tax=unclassified Acinetobacter TaxID=196816 RepID=UPI0029343B51|nr:MULTISPECIES: hypothetical protein [unclassified Acinetobacter]WOE32913.1 hypothetical protein QSG84_07070 [Acinetobacter sp. SAAs470]WOE38390.1 hypothetical protein QSG86_16125 [Acinetobacter sp. SAAs474]
MKNLINFIFILLLNTSLTGCGVLFATGNWWNNDYAPYDEIWVHPKLEKDEARKIRIICSDKAEEEVSDVKNYQKLSKSEKDKLFEKLSPDKYKKYNVLQENCYLDNGFKFYPRGIKRNHPTVCFGESKKMPGCQSVFDIPIL